MKIDLGQSLDRLTRIQNAMGIDQPVELPDIDWHALSGAGIDVAPTDLEIDDEGIPRFHGQAVVVYIREQNSSPDGQWSTFKYHLADCSTLQGMRHSGRAHRYTVTNRTDGWFDCVVGSGWTPHSPRTLRMRLCFNCLKQLEPDTYWKMSQATRLETARNYDLAAHFHTYQNVGHTPPVPPPPQGRTPTPTPRPTPPRPSPETRQLGIDALFPPAPALPPEPPPPALEPLPTPVRPSLIGLPAWAPRDTDEQFLAALLHIDRHGAITEPELAQMLGGARRVRRFARALNKLTLDGPWRVQRTNNHGVSTFRRLHR